MLFKLHFSCIIVKCYYNLKALILYLNIFYNIINFCDGNKTVFSVTCHDPSEITLIC